MNDVVTGADIAACLQLELGAARTFLEILQQEERALVEGEIERLETLSADKLQMAERLAELAARRNQCLATLSLDPDSKGMEAWLADCRRRDTLAERPVAGTAAKAAAAWRYLLQVAQTARQLNQTNGKMIAARLQHHQQAFAALQSAAGVVSLYGPRGQTLGYSGGRPLGRV